MKHVVGRGAPALRGHLQKRSGSTLGLLAVAATVALAASVTSAHAAVGPRAVVVPAGTIALTPDHTFSLPVNNPGGAWAMAPDGTFWNANQGAVGHYDSAGNNLGGGFSTSSSITPSQLGVDGSRLYISYTTSGSGQGVAAYSLTGGSGQTPATIDGGTSSRYDGQAYLRVAGNAMFLPTGQRNKIGLVDLSTFATSPFYPQSWYGVDINESSPPVSHKWEACAYSDGSTPVNGSLANCGTDGGGSGTYDILSYPVDVAVGEGGSLLVLNNGSDGSHGGNNVELLTAGSDGYVPWSSFGGGYGSGAGQLNAPSSIVRDGTSGDVFIADSGNDRISEFGANGSFLASFGYGVLDGANSWEACGVGIGNGHCQAGITYYYNQLSIYDGQLFAEGITSSGQRGQIQVLNLSNGTPSTPAPSPTAPSPTSTAPVAPAPGPTTPAPVSSSPISPTPTPPVPHLTIRLKANHATVAKKQRARLTATVGPSSDCANRTVLFQQLRGHSWVTVSRVRVGRHCATTVSSPVITGTTKLRAVILSASRITLATSKAVVIKPKR